MKKLTIVLAAAFAAALACVLCGCAGGGESAGANGGSGDAAAQQQAGATEASLPQVTVGTLATEDILPYWVAEDEGLFAAAGLDAQVTVFQSATELIAGLVSGEVDYAMTDPMVAASVFASGTGVQIEWITLGATAVQGRFGIMTSADSGITELADLAGVPIGVGSNTILEYVMDTLLLEAGVPEDEILTEELQKLPVRYQQMEAGQVAAAALPASLLALGEANGCVLIADDTQGANISQSVMVVRSDFLAEEGGADTLALMKQVWDQAVSEINAAPEDYRALLVAKANLSEAIAQSYPISEYPTCQLPTNEMIDPILSWMLQKGYLTEALSYDEATGEYQFE